MGLYHIGFRVWGLNSVQGVIIGGCRQGSIVGVL